MLGLFPPPCKTVSRITYTVLVETLNPAQSNPIPAPTKGVVVTCALSSSPIYRFLSPLSFLPLVLPSPPHLSYAALPSSTTSFLPCPFPHPQPLTFSFPLPSSHSHTPSLPLLLRTSPTFLSTYTPFSSPSLFLIPSFFAPFHTPLPLYS